MLKKLFFLFSLFCLFSVLVTYQAFAQEEEQPKSFEQKKSDILSDLKLLRQELATSNEELKRYKISLQDALEKQESSKKRIINLENRLIELQTESAGLLNQTIELQNSLTELKKEFETYKADVQAEIKRLKKEVRIEKLKKWRNLLVGLIAGYGASKVIN